MHAKKNTLTHTHTHTRQNAHCPSRWPSFSPSPRLSPLPSACRQPGWRRTSRPSGGCGLDDIVSRAPFLRPSGAKSQERENTAKERPCRDRGRVTLPSPPLVMPSQGRLGATGGFLWQQRLCTVCVCVCVCVCVQLARVYVCLACCTFLISTLSRLLNQTVSRSAAPAPPPPRTLRQRQRGRSTLGQKRHRGWAARRCFLGLHDPTFHQHPSVSGGRRSLLSVVLAPASAARLRPGHAAAAVRAALRSAARGAREREAAKAGGRRGASVFSSSPGCCLFALSFCA